jgi:predicted dithiol-disulfide oxidoreductase (DUF899 family)
MVNSPQVASREEWLAARKELLVREKEAARARDALNAERRRLPMVRIDKDYLFEGEAGRASLTDLFDGRRQLIVYHFMFEPTWDEGCHACSFVVDNIGHLAHLHARDTSLVLVSRAPLARIEAFKARMGWTIPWYSSFGSDFNYDFHVTSDESVAPVEYNYRDRAALEQAGMTYTLSGEQPGASVFLRDGDSVYHTYSTYARGLEPLIGTYDYLDLTPLGRQEDARGLMGWVTYHDGQAPLPGHRRPLVPSA